MDEKISQFDWPTEDTSCHGKLILVHTRKLAPETDSCNRFALGACATFFFARNRWCRRGSFAPGACCRSVLREQAPSCVPALMYRGILVYNIYLISISNLVSDGATNKSVLNFERA